MELRHLRYFIAVAEHENVSRAAKKLHVSQPALSRQVRDLEDELGLPLLTRTAKSIHLTEAGKTFLGEARSVIQRAADAVKKTKAVATGEQGRLRVGYAPSLTIEILPRALRKFESACPGVRVLLHDLSTEESLRRLAEKKIDVVLTVRPCRPLPGLVFTRLASYPILCAVAPGHALARKRSLSLAGLKDERLLVFSREDYPEAHDWLAGLFKPSGFVPKDTEEYDGASELMTAVEAGRGAAIVAASFKTLAGARLKFVPFAPALPPLVVGALTPAIPARWSDRFIAAAQG